MARNQTVITILQNVLALNRVKKECYYQPIRVDFSPIQKPNNTFQEIIPYFNHDKNYYTPAFIIPKDKIQISENLILQKNKFQARISHYESKQEQQTPQFKPTDNQYCQLCQQHFQDYWEHINCKYHKRMINSSKFNKDIIKLTQKFKITNQCKMPTKDKKINKSKIIKKNMKNKVHDKTQESIKIEKNQLKTYKLVNNLSINTFKIDIKKIQRNNIDQNLKINLQLGNFSTNMASTNLM